MSTLKATVNKTSDKYTQKDEIFDEKVRTSAQTAIQGPNT